VNVGFGRYYFAEAFSFKELAAEAKIR